MQQHPDQRLLSRLSHFLKNSHGQLFAKWSAYSALGCLTVGTFLADYSRLASPLIIGSVFLSYVGMASRSHRRVAQVVLALWVIPANMLFPALFNFGDQSSQQVRLQHQLIQLENQYNSLQNQRTALLQQQPFLQVQYDIAFNTHLGDQVLNAIGNTAGDVWLLNYTLHSTNDLIGYSTWLLQENYRNVAGVSLSESNQEAIKDNGEQIHSIQQLNVNRDIQENNSFLPASERSQPVPRAYQANCVSGYSCVVQQGWQQPFIDGWQRISKEPLSATWFFWLSLLLAIPGMFFLLPLTMSRRWVVSYRVLYNGPLSNLNDVAFPQQKRQALSGETSIVKIGVHSPLIPRKQEDQRDEIPAFLYLNLGPGTTVLDVFLGQQYTQQRDAGLVAVGYDTMTGDIVLQVKPVATQIARPEKGVQRFDKKRTWKEMRALQKTMRRFPLQFYVVIDYFANTIKATTPLTDIERLQEQRGPGWLGRIAIVCHELCWWISALVFYFALQNCSYLFFRNSTTPASFFSWGLGLFIFGFLLKIVELIIMKTTTRRQRDFFYDDLATLTHVMSIHYSNNQKA